MRIHDASSKQECSKYDINVTMTLVAFMAANQANAQAHEAQELVSPRPAAPVLAGCSRRDRRASSASAPVVPTTKPAACSGNSVGFRSTSSEFPNANVERSSGHAAATASGHSSPHKSTPSALATSPLSHR